MSDLDEYGQPTIECLHKAWSSCIEAENIPGARSETRMELRRLRNIKTTWFGSKENELRVALDNYLGGQNDRTEQAAPSGSRGRCANCSDDLDK